MFGREHNCGWRQRAEALSQELEKLKRDAPFVDPATGLGNLHHLHLQFVKLLGRWRRYGEPFAITLLRLSDPLHPEAHLSAQASLQLARVLMESARVEDAVCRASSEEFAILLANTTKEGGLAFLERARNNVAREPVRTGHGSRFFRSVAGVAQWSDDMHGLRELLQAADSDLSHMSDEVSMAARAYLAD